MDTNTKLVVPRADVTRTHQVGHSSVLPTVRTNTKQPQGRASHDENIHNGNKVTDDTDHLNMTRAPSLGRQ